VDLLIHLGPYIFVFGFFDKLPHVLL